MNELTLALTKPMPLAVAPTSDVSYVDIRRHPEVYPRINDVPAELAQRAMEQIIFRAMFYKAASSLKDDDIIERISLMASELLILLKADDECIGTKHLSFAEIARAVRTATISSQKEMYGISVSSLYNAIADYCLNEGHKAAKIVREEKWAKKALPQETPKDTPLLDIDFDKALAKMAKGHNLNGKI